MTTIAPTISSQIPQWIFYLGTEPAWERISAGCSTVEGAFYASLRATSSAANRTVKWVRETTTGHIQEIQTVFNAANALIVAFYAKKLIDEIQAKFQFSLLDLAAAWTFGALPVVLAAGAAFTIGVLILDPFTKNPIVQNPAEAMTGQQKMAKALHVTKLVLNVALACFVKNRFWFVVGLAGSTYSLFSDYRRKELNLAPPEQASPAEAEFGATFEKLYATYSVAQAGLAYLGKYPELAATIYSIQKMMLVTDSIGFGGTTILLYEKVRAKFNVSGENSSKFDAAVAITYVALLALSAYAAFRIGTYLKPAIALNDLLTKLDISPDLLKNTTAEWASSEFLQGMYATRTVFSTALAFFSKQRMANLVSAIAQAFSLNAISRLHLIRFTQTFDYPLEKIFAQGGSGDLFSLNKRSLQNLTVTSEFLVDSSCASNPHHLQSTLKSIYGYITRLFDKSWWSRYWLITRHNGVPIRRALYYKVLLQETPVAPCGCTLIPNLTDLTMSGRDADYGWANFDIRR